MEAWALTSRSLQVEEEVMVDAGSGLGGGTCGDWSGSLDGWGWQEGTWIDAAENESCS